MDLDKAQANTTLDVGNVGHNRSARQIEPAGGWAWSLLCVGAALSVSLWSLPRSIQAGDAGEFATVMLTGGVPHPSGYPWMRILGVLARGLWAVGVPPAIAAALPPALCGVAAWLLVQRICVAIDRPRLGALASTLVAVSPLAVIHVNDSEVWGPHLLFSALFIHTVIHNRSALRPLWLGLTLGLAVSHHLTAVLLVPLAVGAALPDRNRDASGGWWRALVRNGALGLAGSLAGLLPVATLPIGPGRPRRRGGVRSLDGLLHHVARRDYGTLSLSLHEEQVAIADTVGRALISVGEVFSAGLVASSLFGAAL